MELKDNKKYVSDSFINSNVKTRKIKKCPVELLLLKTSNKLLMFRMILPDRHYLDKFFL